MSLSDPDIAIVILQNSCNMFFRMLFHNFKSSSHYPLPPSQPSPTGEGVAKHFPLGGK